MSKSQVAPGSAQALIELRRARILAAVGPRPLPAHTGCSADRVAYFRREAEDLYWNELTWEQMTDEETIAGGHLTELVFPGLLTLVGGLLPEPGLPERGPATRSFPCAVEEILTFLGERAAALTAELQAGIDSQQILWARAMTLRLIDLVLYRLYRLSPDEQEMIEAPGNA